MILDRKISSVAAGIGFALALYPMLLWYVRRMSDGSDEPLGLVALAAAGFFAWNGRERLSAGQVSRNVAIACLAIYGALVWLEFPPLLRSLPALAAIACWFGLWRLPAVVALLLLSLPMMASLQFYLGYPLRLFTAETATVLLNLLNVGVIREGAQLIHDGTAVGVDPPCSGVRMLWASVFLAAAVAGKLALSWRGTIELGLVAFLLAIFANAIRASLLFFPEAKLVSLPRWTHEAIGNVCFAAGVILLIAAARKLQFKFALSVA